MNLYQSIIAFPKNRQNHSTPPLQWQVPTPRARRKILETFLFFNRTLLPGPGPPSAGRGAQGHHSLSRGLSLGGGWFWSREGSMGDPPQPIFSRWPGHLPHSLWGRGPPGQTILLDGRPKRQPTWPYGMGRNWRTSSHSFSPHSFLGGFPASCLR